MSKHTAQIYKKYIDLKKKMYTWHVHKIEKFRYPISDVRGKGLAKTVFVTVSGKVLL